MMEPQEGGGSLQQEWESVKDKKAPAQAAPKAAPKAGSLASEWEALKASQAPPAAPFVSAPSAPPSGAGGAASAPMQPPAPTASPSMQGGGAPPSGLMDPLQTEPKLKSLDDPGRANLMRQYWQSELSASDIKKEWETAAEAMRMSKPGTLDYESKNRYAGGLLDRLGKTQDYSKKLKGAFDKDIDTITDEAISLYGDWLLMDRDGVKFSDPTKTMGAARYLSAKLGIEDEDFQKVLYDRLKSKSDVGIVAKEADKKFEQTRKGLDEEFGKRMGEAFTEDDAIAAAAKARMASMNADYSARIKADADAVSSSIKQDFDAMDAGVKALNADYEARVSTLNRQIEAGAIPQQQAEAAFAQMNEAYKQQFAQYEQGVSALNAKSLGDISAINRRYNSAFAQEQKRLIAEAEEATKRAAEKFTKEFGDSEEGRAMRAKYKRAYEEDWKRAMNERGESIQGAADKRFEDRVGQFFGNPIPAFAERFAESTVSGLGGSLKGIATTTGAQDLYVLGEEMERITALPEAKSDALADLLEGRNLAQLSGQLAGGMAPSIAATAVVGAATVGMSIPARLALTGAAGWGAETMDLAGRAYDDMLRETRSREKASEAAYRTLKGQVQLMPAYAFDGLPFIGKALDFVPTKAGRVFAGGMAEYGTEMFQEIPQSVAEKNIREGMEPYERLADQLGSMSDSGELRQLLIGMAPITVLGGAGQVASKSAKRQLEDGVKEYILKSRIADVAPDVGGQWVDRMQRERGTDFTRATIASLMAGGHIDEAKAEELLRTQESVMKLRDEASRIRLNDDQARIYTALGLQEGAMRQRAEAEQNPILKKALESRANEIFKSIEGFVNNGTKNYVEVKLGEGNDSRGIILDTQAAGQLFNDSKFISEVAKMGDFAGIDFHGEVAAELAADFQGRVANVSDLIERSKYAKAERMMGRAERIAKAEERSLNEQMEEAAKAPPQIPIADDVDDEVRDAMIARRAELGIAYDPLDDLPESVAVTFERVEDDKPVSPFALDAASDFLYKKYKDVVAMRDDPKRLLTLEQIDSYAEQLGKDIELLENHKQKLKDEAAADPAKTKEPERAATAIAVAEEPRKRKQPKSKRKRRKQPRISIDGKPVTPPPVEEAATPAEDAIPERQTEEVPVLTEAGGGEEVRAPREEPSAEAPPVSEEGQVAAAPAAVLPDSPVRLEGAAVEKDEINDSNRLGDSTSGSLQESKPMQSDPRLMTAETLAAEYSIPYPEKPSMEMDERLSVRKESAEKYTKVPAMYILPSLDRMQKMGLLPTQRKRNGLDEIPNLDRAIAGIEMNYHKGVYADAVKSGELTAAQAAEILKSAGLDEEATDPSVVIRTEPVVSKGPFAEEKPKQQPKPKKKEDATRKDELIGDSDGTGGKILQGGDAAVSGERAEISPPPPAQAPPGVPLEDAGEVAPPKEAIAEDRVSATTKLRDVQLPKGRRKIPVGTLSGEAVSGGSAKIFIEATPMATKGRYRVTITNDSGTENIPWNFSPEDTLSDIARAIEEYYKEGGATLFVTGVGVDLDTLTQKKEQEADAATKPINKAKTTGSREDDDRLAQYRKMKRQKQPMGASQEKAMALYENREKADPSKWSEGDGVGYSVAGYGGKRQINRGFRIVSINPETKIAVVRQVADTGLTSTGGDFDRIGDTRVHVAELTRDRKYDAPKKEEVAAATDERQPAKKKEEPPKIPTGWKRDGQKSVEKPTAITDEKNKTIVAYSIPGYEDIPIVSVKAPGGWRPAIKVGDTTMVLGSADSGEGMPSFAAARAWRILEKHGREKVEAMVEKSIKEQQSLADKIDKAADELEAKLKGMAGAFPIPPQIIVGAMRAAAKVVRAGSSVVNAVKEAINYIRDTDWYKKLNDTDKGKAEREVRQQIRVALEPREPKGPSPSQVKKAAEKDTVKREVRKVTMSEVTALKEQIRAVARGARGAVADVAKARKEFVAQVKDLLSKDNLKGSLTDAQARSITTRAAGVNPLNPKAVERFADYAQRIADDVNAAAKEAEAAKLRKRIRTAIKGKADERRDAMVNDLAGDFARININEADIDEYLSIANRLLRTLANPKAKASDAAVSALDTETLINNSELQEYIDKQNAIEDAIAEREAMEEFDAMREAIGIDEASMTADELESLIASINGIKERTEAIQKLSEDRQKTEMLRTMARVKLKELDGYAAFRNRDPETSISKDRMATVRDLGKIDIDSLKGDEAAFLITAVNNIILNDRWGGTRDFAAKGRAEEGFAIIDKAFERLKEVGRPGDEDQGWRLFNLTDSAEIMAEKIARGPTAAAEFFRGIGMHRWLGSISSAKRQLDEAVRRREEFAKSIGFNPLKDDTVLNRYKMGFYAYLIQNKGGTAEQIQQQFDRRSANVRTSIERMNNPNKFKGLERNADLYIKAAEDVLGDAKGADGLSIDPKLRRMVEFQIQEARRYKEDTFIAAEDDHNKALRAYENWTAQRSIPSRANLKADQQKDLFEERMWGNRLIDSAPSSSKMDRSDTLLEGHVINPDFFSVQDESLFETLADNLGARHLATLRESINDPRMEALVGASTVKMLQDRVRSIKGLEAAKGDFLSGAAAKAYHVIAKRSMQIALKGIMQAPKQATVGIATWIGLGRDRDLLAGSYSDAISAGRGSDGDWQYDLIKDEQVHERGKTLAGLEKVGDPIAKNAILTGRESSAERRAKVLSHQWVVAMDRGMVPLSYVDALSAQAAWFAFYKKKLRDKGVDLDNDAWKTGKDDEAAAYANQMVSRMQNANAVESMAQIYREKGAGRILVDVFFAYSSFALNMRKRMARDIQTLRTGSVEDRAYAVRDLVGAAAETTAYTAVSYFLAAAAKGMFDQLADTLFGDDDDEPEIPKDWWKDIAGRASFDLLFGGMPEIASNEIKAGANTASSAIAEHFGTTIREDGKNLFYVPRSAGEGRFGAVIDTLANLWSGVLNIDKEEGQMLATLSFMSLVGASDQFLTRPMERELSGRLKKMASRRKKKKPSSSFIPTRGR